MHIRTHAHIAFADTHRYMYIQNPAEIRVLVDRPLTLSMSGVSGKQRRG